MLSKRATSLLPFLIFLFISFFITKSFDFTMFNDGWRHLAMAINNKEIISWNNIFINSLYTNFDPWFTWHFLLKKLGYYFGNQNIHIVVNSIFYFFLSSWYFLILKKYSKINLFFIFLISSFLPIMNIKYFQLRPDIIFGFLILYTLILKRTFIILLINVLFAPLYYIFWFFFSYSIIIYLILKKYTISIILLIATFSSFVIYFAYDYEGYLHMLNLIINNDKLTRGHAVLESYPLFIPIGIKNYLGSFIFMSLLFLISLFIYYKFKFKNNIYRFLILYLPLMIFQIRFYELLKPLIYAGLIIFIHEFTKNLLKIDLSSVIKKMNIFIKNKTYFYKFTPNMYKSLFSFFIFIFFLQVYTQNKFIYEKSLENVQFISTITRMNEFKNKRIFFTRMNLMMDTAYLFNPNSKYLPNCSLGWMNYDKKNMEIYFKILNKDKTLTAKELFNFINFNKIDYFIIDLYFYSNITFSSQEIDENGYSFHKIIQNYIIFKKRDNE